MYTFQGAQSYLGARTILVPLVYSIPDRDPMIVDSLTLGPLCRALRVLESLKDLCVLPLGPPGPLGPLGRRAPGAPGALGTQGP